MNLLISKTTTDDSESISAFLFLIAIITIGYGIIMIIKIAITQYKKGQNTTAAKSRHQLQKEISDALRSERNINNPKYFGGVELRTPTRVG
jgi:hypothetical protein